jgi:uridine kinase
MKSVNIKVIGEAGTGKTSFAVLIQNILRHHGFVNVHLDDPDYYEGMTIERVNESMKTLSKRIAVNIESVQTNREGKCLCK